MEIAICTSEQLLLFPMPRVYKGCAFVIGIIRLRIEVVLLLYIFFWFGFAYPINRDVRAADCRSESRMLAHYERMAKALFAAQRNAATREVWALKPCVVAAAMLRDV